MAKDKPIKTTEEIANGSYVRYLFGMNLFEVNKVGVSPEENPRLMFIKKVIKEARCLALIGNLFDLGDGPEEIFNLNPVYYEKVRVGCYGGKFYNFDDWTNFPPFLVEKPSDSFHTTSAETLLYAIKTGALSIYISQDIELMRRELKSLLKNQFINDEEWVKASLTFTDVLITTNQDGTHFVVRSKDRDSFDLIDKVTEEMNRYIESADWYKHNRDNLAWDYENNLCLMAG